MPAPSSLLSNPHGSVEETRWRLAGEYCFLVSDTSRASARAELLRLGDSSILARPHRITTRRVMAWQLRHHHRLLGAIRMQLELGFRATFDRERIMDAAEHGIVRIAVHPQLDGFPLGAALALPAHALGIAAQPLIPNGAMIVFALACHPSGLGAGRALIDDLRHDCAELSSCPRLVTFSPLTGLRTRVIGAADDPATPPDVAAGLASLLRARRYPVVSAPVAQWLRRAANAFASSPDYAAGRFHRATGARLRGVAAHSDSGDCDAVWMRAIFTYAV